MVYKPHCRIVFRGKFKNTPEEWSFSTKWQKDLNNEPDMDIFNIDASGMQNAIAGLFDRSEFQSNVQCTGWRAYNIDANGRMEGNPRIVEFDPATVLDGIGGITRPPQVALCVTLEADNRGPARFGRFYLPGPAVALGSDSLISQADATAMATTVRTFLYAVRDSIDIPQTLARARMVNTSAVGTGTEQYVTKIKVGRVLDTIRRRRFQLVEGYSELDADLGE